MAILLISFFAWVLTVLAPCILPMLPIILWASVKNSKNSLKPYIIIASLSVSVILFSLLLKASTLLIGFDKSILTWISGIIIIFFGIITLFPNLWKNFSKKIWFSSSSNKALGKTSQKQGFCWDVLIWFSLGPVFTSCSPTYAIILATILPVSFAFGLLNLIAYTLGLAIILLCISLLWQKFTKKLRGISDPNSKFKKILGIIFIIVGLVIITWLDKKIETIIIEKWYFWPVNFEQSILDKVEGDINKFREK